MTELYWITRLDNLQGFFIVLFSISMGVALFSFIAWYGEDFDNNTHWKTFKITFPIALISALGLVFIPSTKDALIIYGVGGTVEYLRENPTARQLPDKCVEALDKFVDEYLEEDK